jgi:uncharacterized protein YjbI with pentapeptide repeats
MNRKPGVLPTVKRLVFLIPAGILLAILAAIVWLEWHAGGLSWFAVSLGVLLVGALILIVLRACYNPQWAAITGFRPTTSTRGKTLWDWLELLIIPIVLAGGGLWFNAHQDDLNHRLSETQHQSDLQLQQDQQQASALEAYFNNVSDLLLKYNLLSSKPGDEPRVLARAWTLTVLEGLDPQRKRAVVQFLQEAQLIHSHDDGQSIVSLDGADLSSANLDGLDLSSADLRGANLSNARLELAFLLRVDLRGADLVHADLNRTFLVHADLRGAVLTSASLSSAVLSAALLGDANLEDADLSQALLEGYQNGYQNGFITIWPGIPPRGIIPSDVISVEGSADLSGAWLIHTHLHATHAKGVNLHQAFLSKVDAQGADLQGADLSSAEIGGANLRKTRLNGADLTAVKNRDYSQVTSDGMPKTASADFTDSDLSNTRFSNADLRGDALVRAKLTRANLQDANLTQADLRDATLDGADLTNATVTNVQLDSAASLQGATLPDGSTEP